ncbi:DUF4230 domain-containing protein [Agromyces sp. M3QZ16-3]|uniref:DUF4230 domain-containing protein n=1 Tax=Agromyces sp. M3QZ16-3 TaxID=3447585 RepID=UPI003F693E0A
MIKGIALVVVGAALALAGLGAANVVGFDPFQLRHTDRSQPALLKSIQDMSEYHAAAGNFEIVLDVEEDVEWLPDAIAGRRTLFVAAGTVDAYVDFSGLSGDDLKLSQDGTSVTVRLPEPQLAEPNLDSDRSYVFEQQRGVLASIADAIDVPQHSQFYSLAETKLAAAAEESELRDRAAQNTRDMLSGMFGSLGIHATFE